MNEDTFPDGTRRCCDSYPGTEHDEHCPTPLWPAGDATPERFSLLIHEDQSVSVLDGERILGTYRGPSPLADALTERARLVEREAAGIAEPAAFLAETLPAYARTQRLEGMLAEVRAAESSALAGLTEAITLLNRAVSLRERLEKALEAASRPLSATEKPEQAAGVRRDIPHFGRLRGEAAKLHVLYEGQDVDGGILGSALSKPQPY